MAENNISYLTNTYDDFRNAIIDKSQKYYSDIFYNFDDASIGTWWIDVISDVSDVLRYNIDRAYQETSIDSATSRNSLNQIARTNGLKIPGPKCAIVEVEISCKIPMNRSEAPEGENNMSIPDYSYFPYIKRGTILPEPSTFLTNFLFDIPLLSYWFEKSTSSINSNV